MTQANTSSTAAQAIDSHLIPITFFDDKFAAVKYEDSLTLPDLADEIRRMTDRAKKKLPWLKLAIFGNIRTANNSLRSNDNVAYITGVEVDYDSGATTFDQAIERLEAAGLRALVYTSASHKPGVKEKWRVLCPASQPLPPEARHGLAAVLHGVLGPGIDGSASFTLSTAFYYGSVNSSPDHRVEVLDGDFIDLRVDLVAGAVGKPPRAAPDGTVNSGELNERSAPGEAPGYSDADIEAMLDKSQFKNSDGSGNWWDNMLAVVGSLVGRGLGDEAILERVMPFAYEDVNVRKFIESARKKWNVPDPDIEAGTLLGGDVLAAIAKDAPEATARARLVEPNWRERYVTGYPKPSLHNARLAIAALHVQCSADVFHNKLFMGRGEATELPLLPFHGEVTDDAIGSLRMTLSNTWGFDLTEKHVRDAVSIACRENCFDPVVDMLAEAEASWDGVERLDRMAVEHFNAEDTELNRQMVRKTMIAAVARARRPGCKFDTITVLEAPEGWNKSSAWAVLAGEGNFSDSSILGKAGREVQEELAGIWIHENAELAGITKAEVEVIKAFASRQVDRARPAYGHFLVEQPRRSIEVGTTNADRYLLSPTGNRRFWPITLLAPIDLGKLRAARLQLWGEAARYQALGESLTLDERLWAAAAVEQEERRVAHPWEAQLADMGHIVPVEGVGYHHHSNGVVHVIDGEERVSTAVIFKHVLNLSEGQMNMGHTKTLAAIMRAQGWKHGVFKLDGKTVKGYLRTKFRPSYR